MKSISTDNLLRAMKRISKNRDVTFIYATSILDGVDVNNPPKNMVVPDYCFEILRPELDLAEELRNTPEVKAMPVGAPPEDLSAQKAIRNLFENATICFSGFRSNKLTSYLKATHKATVRDNMRSDTDILIVENSQKKPTGKVKKAKAQGIRIYSLDQINLIFGMPKGTVW